MPCDESGSCRLVTALGHMAIQRQIQGRLHQLSTGSTACNLSINVLCQVVRGYLHGKASHRGSTALGLSHRQTPTTEKPAMRKDGMAATRAMLSSLAFRIWSISSIALSVSTLSFCTYTNQATGHGGQIKSNCDGVQVRLSAPEHEKPSAYAMHLLRSILVTLPTTVL